MGLLNSIIKIILCMTNKNPIVKTSNQTTDFAMNISRMLSSWGMTGVFFCVMVIFLLPGIDLGESSGENYGLLLTKRQYFIISWLILSLCLLENAYLHNPNVISHILCGFGILSAIMSSKPGNSFNLFVGSGPLSVVLIPWLLFIFHRILVITYLRQNRIVLLDTAKVMEYRPSIKLFVLGWFWFWFSGNYGLTS
jgi:hypothetical protein